MSPTEQERLATLEAERKSDRELLQEIRKEVKRLPRRISKNTRRQLERCREQQEKNCNPGKSSDYSWLRKLLVVGLFLGSIIGGAIYGLAYEGVSAKAPILKQGVKP